MFWWGMLVGVLAGAGIACYIIRVFFIRIMLKDIETLMKLLRE